MSALDLSDLGPKTEKEAPEVEAETVEWAFIVYKQLDGETVMHHDVNLPVAPLREPHPDEVHGAASNIMMDISAMKTASYAANATVNGMMQLTAQMQQAQQNAMIQQQLGKNLRG